MIYIDKANWNWKGKKWCHLLADTVEELHEFAKKLGLKREWFQDKKSFPHYDLVESKREKALELGAEEIKNRSDYLKILTIANVLKREKK
jgi:hypothetical protein